MRSRRHVLPLLLAGACSGAGATISVTAATPAGWSGTSEALVHDATGALVRRVSFSGHADVPFEDGQIITVVVKDMVGADLRPSLATYYGVAPGDAVVAQIGDPGTPTFHALSVHLPDGPAQAVVDLSAFQLILPSYTPGAVAQLEMRDRPPGPMLATIHDDNQIYGFTGAAAVDTSGSSVTLDRVLTPRTIALTMPALPTGTVASSQAYVISGEQWIGVPVPRAAATDTLVVPSGLGARQEVSLSLSASVTGPRQFLAETFDGDPPAQIDFTQPALTPPTIASARFDGARFTWTASSAHLALTWSLLAGTAGHASTAWSFTAPPDATTEPLPALPADLDPGAAWVNDGFGAFSSPDADYAAWIADPSWSSHGSHVWTYAWAPMTK